MELAEEIVSISINHFANKYHRGLLENNKKFKKIEQIN